MSSIMVPIIESPKVFISYAWDSDESNDWVKNLATDLRNSGIDAQLDQWKLVPGDRLTLFMEQSVKENKYILIICSEKYKDRSENRIGGVGYEGDIMTAEVLQNNNPRKFIPILQSGDMTTAIPAWLTGRLFIDFTNQLHYANSFDSLMRTLLNLREPEPQLGEIPEKYKKELAAMKAAEVVVSEVLETTIVNKQSAELKESPLPFLEADLIWHGSSRSPRGYSDKNPKELDENGQYVTVIGAGVKPIIFWELSWRFDLAIYNNSSFPAFNISLESIGEIGFDSLEKLNKINNLKPLDQVVLKASVNQYIEDVHTVADSILAEKVPAKLNGLTIKISYRAEDGQNHVTLMKIEKGKVINVRE